MTSSALNPTTMQTQALSLICASWTRTAALRTASLTTRLSEIHHVHTSQSAGTPTAICSTLHSALFAASLVKTSTAPVWHILCRDLASVARAIHVSSQCASFSTQPHARFVRLAPTARNLTAPCPTLQAERELVLCCSSAGTRPAPICIPARGSRALKELRVKMPDVHSSIARPQHLQCRF